MTSMEEAVSGLVAALTKKKQYLQQIKSLAQKQSAALDRDDPEELSIVLEAREGVIEEVQALDAEEAEAARFLRAAVSEEKVRTKAPIDALEIVGDIEELIREIQAIDSKNLTDAEKIREDLRSRLQDISNHRKSQKLYKGEGKGISGAFLNKSR